MRVDVAALPVVEVEWLDSVSVNGWRPVSSIDELCNEEDAMLQRSVGFLYHDGDDRIVLVRDGGLGLDPELGDAMAIPKVCVKKMRRLTTPRR